MRKVFGMFLLLFGVLGDANLFAEQVVSWSQPELAVSILAGTAQQVEISFTSSKDLASVDITLVPEISSFVSVRPSHFAAISKGTTTKLSVVFSVASSAEIGIYEGTVHLRRSKATLASPLPVQLTITRASPLLIPTEVSIPSLDRIVSDPVTGLKYAANEIILFASPTATREDVVSLAMQSSAAFLGSDESLGLYELLLPFNGLVEALSIVTRLQADPHVSFAVIGSLGQGSQANVRIPTDPFWSDPYKRWAQELVHLPGAWYQTTGTMATKIAIVDLGFDTTHEDLPINTATSDTRANFVQNHGTAVASLAAAIGNNHPTPLGLAGAMWSSDLQVFSCSAPDGSAWIPWCQHVTRLAIDRGVSVINMSFGTEYSTICVPPSTVVEQVFQNDMESWRRVLRYATTSPTRSPNGVVFVMGAGNDLTSVDRFVPAALSLEPEFPNAISVGALDRLGNQASYSNYGGVTVWAPGGDGPVKMCNGRHSSPTDPSAALGLPSAGIWTAQEGNNYDYMAGVIDCFFSGRCPGTSFAAPFVSGVAGLMLSANPNITATQIKNIIMTTADDTGKVDPSGNKIKLLNAFEAVQRALAPPPPGTFMKAIGSTGDDFASSIQRTSDGGFIVAGYTTGLGAGGQDVLLVKLDGSGVIQWAKTAGTAGGDIAYSVRQTSDGGYVVSGSTDGVTGVGQFLVSKFDGSGAFQWASTLGDPSDSAAGLSAQQTTDGGYIATGFPAGAIGGLGLLKYSPSGQLQWLRRAVGTNLYGNSVQQTSDGGYIVAGAKQIGTTQYDLTLLKFDGSGNLQWAQLAGGSGNESGNAVQQTSDGGYIVAGATASSGAGGQDLLLLKYDGSGTLQWARTAGGSGDDEADSVQQTSDGGYIVSGRTASFGVGENTLLLKYDGSGTLQWARAGGGSTSGSTVQQTADGGYFVAGSTASFGAGGSDILLIRTDANGNVAGCAGWASVNPSIGTAFPSAATSYSVDSPSFSVSAPSLTVAPAALTPNNKCP